MESFVAFLGLTPDVTEVLRCYRVTEVLRCYRVTKMLHRCYRDVIVLKNYRETLRCYVVIVL